MAENSESIKGKSESIKGKYVIWGCIECGHNHYIHKDSYTLDALVCEECSGLVKMVGFTNQKPSLVKNAPNKKPLSVRVNVDVSDALKGLKAVQREAKKTARILRDVENHTDIKRLTDDEILAELSFRGWEIDETTFFAGDKEPVMRHIEMNKNKEN